MPAAAGSAQDDRVEELEER